MHSPSLIALPQQFQPTWNAHTRIHCRHWQANRPNPAFLYPPLQRYHPHLTTNTRAIHRIFSQQTPATLQLLQQSHSTICTQIYSRQRQLCADAAITHTPNLALGIYSADCLPIVITNTSGRFVAAIHAGWRGLYHGIIDTTLKQLSHLYPCSPKDYCVWIGPSITQENYRVCATFKAQFLANDVTAGTAFLQRNDGHYFSCQQYAMMRLRTYGIQNIACASYCTFSESTLPSYRRDGANNPSRILTTVFILA